MARTVALTWNLDTGKLSAATDYLKRAENVTFVLTCYTDSAKTLLPANWALTLALKPDDDYDTGPLVQITGWTEAATAKTYTSPVTAISSTALDTLLLKNADGTDDVIERACAIDINYTISSLLPTKSDTMAITLKNDVSRADDAAPGGATVNGLCMPRTSLTGSATGSLDSIVTASSAVASGTIAFCVVSSVLSVWRLAAGTTAENTALGIVRPDDYAASTNEFIWTQIL